MQAIRPETSAFLIAKDILDVAVLEGSSDDNFQAWLEKATASGQPLFTSQGR
jgi:hypothetical protein